MFRRMLASTLHGAASMAAVMVCCALGFAERARSAEAPTEPPRDIAPPAVETAQAGVVVYPASFYGAYRPQTALDMLDRTPGFALDAPDADELQRGFGANAGNVLVNGARPTVKSGGVEAYLARINAARVQRIELMRGALMAEAQGHSLVANLVLSAEKEPSGQLAFELRRAPGDDVITPKLDGSHALHAGGWDISTSLAAYYEENPSKGRQEGYGADGTQSFVLRDEHGEKEYGGTFTGGVSRPLGGGEFAVNVRLGGETEDATQRFIPDEAPEVAEVVRGSQRLRERELGVDWSRPVNEQWTAKFVTLGRWNGERYVERQEGEDTVAGQDGDTTEWVGRIALLSEGERWLRPEFNVELAWNRADSEFTLTENGVPVDLPGADSRVSELRGEAGTNLTLTLNEALRLETNLAYERSRIQVRGDTRDQRTLDYWKPSLAAVWDVQDSTQVRLGWRRSVSQLDFGGFAASGDLINDRPIAGNAELSPEVTEGWSARVDQRYGEGGALTLTLAREYIKDALAFVPLESGEQALLNSTTVAVWSASLTATVPLDAMLNGAQISAEGTWVRARRTDPVTGARRKDAADMKAGELSFRHDVEPWRMAYGVSVESMSPERAWYVAEIESFRFKPYWSAFVETSAWWGVKTTLSLWGLTGEYEGQTRLFYEPDRNGAFAGSERRINDGGMYMNLLFAKQF